MDACWAGKDGSDKEENTFYPPLHSVPSSLEQWETTKKVVRMNKTPVSRKCNVRQCLPWKRLGAKRKRRSVRTEQYIRGRKRAGEGTKVGMHERLWKQPPNGVLFVHCNVMNLNLQYISKPYDSMPKTAMPAFLCPQIAYVTLIQALWYLLQFWS